MISVEELEKFLSTATVPASAEFIRLHFPSFFTDFSINKDG